MAGFSVENFSAALKTSGARSNLFTVTLGAPPVSLGLGVTNNISKSGNAATKFEFLCNATTLPGYVQGEVPVSYFGRTIYFAGDTTFGDWSTTILNDEGAIIRRGIESWMEQINGSSGNVRGSAIGVAHNGLTTTATIKTYSIDGSSNTTIGTTSTPITQVDLKGVWPSNLSPIELSHDATNTIETFTCTWQYQHAEHS
tara:strand:- start:220 stop:816 length:597 start_codon:yes stop_codon:yes gene_type:complete